MTGSYKPGSRLALAVRAAMEQLEDRRLMSADPLAEINRVQSLPFVLDFSTPVNGLHDRDGQDIGFTRVQENRSGLSGSYLPANIDLRANLGILQITSTGTAASGSNYNGDNTLTNAVETQFDATTAGWQITARLQGPLDFINEPSEQGGIMFGPDQDNYVKLVAVSTPSGPVVQLVSEETTSGVYSHQPGASGVVAGIGSFAAVTSLDLRLSGDAATGRVQAFYSVNNGAFVKLASDVVISGAKRAAFFNPAGRAGLVVAHKNNTGPITVSFDRFEISAGTPVSLRPSVLATIPAGGNTSVLRDAFVLANLLLPNGGINNNTLNAETVKLFRVDGAQRTQVAANVGTSGGGDTISLEPMNLLDPNATYTFEVTDGVQDVSGAAFTPFTMTFRTGAAGGEIDPSLAFEKVSLGNATGEGFTCVKIGPDGRLYASTIDGKIISFPILEDGTLGAPKTTLSIQTANGGPRMLTGFTFDPASTPSNPIIWVSHSQYRLGLDPLSPDPVMHYGDDWTGKITKLSGPNLDQIQDVIVGLPRSIRDHLTNQPTFGPDGALYFAQGANSSTGAPDSIWGDRPERMLTAAILRLDPSKVPPDAPLNVKTEDGGFYDPFAPGAALTIYASGVRNAYDLIWTNDGKLYAPTNGSAAGGVTPGTPALPSLGSVRIDGDDDGNPANGQYSGPGVPSIPRTTTSQHDFLFRIEAGGYYGHPNPTRSEYVLGGGYDPSDGVLPNEVPDYGKVVRPDRNYQGYAFDFETSVSPNGVIEYQNAAAFGGALKGKLLVARYGGPNDIIVLTRGSDGNIVSSNHGYAGLRGFADPLDIVENPANGYLYVTEFSERNPLAARITLLRPVVPGANISVSKDQLVFNDIISGNVGGSGGSPVQTLRITNVGSGPLSFPADGFTILDDPNSPGDDRARFTITNLNALPDSVPVGESIDLQVQFTATAVALESAILRIKSNDPDQGILNIPLRGIGTTSDANGVVSGNNEPSLQRILNAYRIPVNVGDSDGEATTSYTPDASSEEVTMPRLRKAGPGPVSIEPLAVFGFTADPVVRLGYYAPGTKDAKTELFIVNSGSRSSVNPVLNGQTSFDPGGDFSLYGIFPGKLFEINGLPREVFSEDVFNTFEPDASLRRKVRFFPLKNPDGSVVPNAYIFAFEEFNGSYDSNDIVGIIRNVRAAPAGPEIGLENLDGAPYPDQLAFNRIQNQPPAPRKLADGTLYQPPNNRVHDIAQVRVRNTGTSALTIASLQISGPFELVNAPAPGTVIAAGGQLDLTVKFNATSGGLRAGTLTINSNDADEPATIVKLSGFWQSDSEGRGSVSTEPTLQQILATLGYNTTVVKSGEVLNQGGRIRRVGDEVLSPYWKTADTSRAVTVRQLSAYHTQGNVATTSWFLKGTSTLNQLFVHEGVEGQSLLPHLESSANNSNAPAYNLFKAAKPDTDSFGFRIDGEWSDPTKNKKPNATDEGHHVRFWVARDRAGKIIPNTYIMSMDYAGINYDYNDNTYIITNVKPESPPAAVTGLTATASGAGILLDWNDSTEANLAGYEVSRGASAAGPFTKITSGLITQSDFTDVLAPSGVVSYYQVVAVDNAGNRSPASSASATRNADNTPPAAPRNLSALGFTSGITLDWADNTEGDLAGYNVLRSATVDGTFVKVNGTLLTGSSFLDATAPAGATSFYQVVAVDKAGNVSAAATTSAARPNSAPPPAAPTGLTASAATPTVVTLNWTASAGAASYRIERRVAGTSAFLEIAFNITATTYTDVGRTPGASYEYRIVAQNSNGLSPYSNVAAVSTPASAPPAAVATLSAVTASPTQINLNWVAAAGAVSYRVQRRSVGGTFADLATGLIGTNYVDTNLTPLTTYEYQVLAENSAGVSAPSPVASATTQPQPMTAYAGANIAAVPPGSFSVPEALPVDSAFDVTTGGTNIYANRDGFYFLYRQISGDFDIKVRVSSLTATAAVAKAGLMARQDLSPESANVIAYATPANGYRMTQRATAGGTTDFFSTGSLVYPNVFVRLKRVGNTYTGYRSADGVNWTVLRSINLAMSGPIYVGLATSANSGVETTTARYRELTDLIPIGQAPGAPSGLTASAASATQINLAFTAGDGATTYRIERRVAGSGAFVEIAQGVVGTSYADTTALPSTTYEYQVRSQNSAGTSGYSNVASAATPAGQSAPLAPTGLSAAPASATQINLTWNLSEGATSYRLQRRSAGGAFADIGAGLTAGTFQDVGLSPGVSYDYQVLAENSAGSSSPSAIVTATTPASVNVPDAPTITSALSTSSTQVTLAWTASANAQTYRLQRRVRGGTFADVASDLTGTTYTDAGLQVGTVYEYQVFAHNAAGDSSPSAVRGVTTAAENAAFTGANIGGPPIPGSLVDLGNGDYDLTGNGYDVFNAFDQLYFASRPVTGDFDFRARLASVSEANAWTKAGLMARGSLAPDARNAFIIATPGANGYRFSYRATQGGTTVPTGTGAVSYPNTWVRLSRVGNVFTGYRSTDGVSWTQVGSVTLNVGSTVYFGPAITSHTTSASATAQFRSLGAVASSPTAPKPPTNLAATTPAAAQISLAWTPTPDATSYAVDRRENGVGDFTTIAINLPTASFVDRGVVGGHTYQYRVVGVGPVGLTLPTNAVMVTALTAAPAGVSRLLVSSSRWSDTMLTSLRTQGLGDDGFALRDLTAPPEQQVLPWSNVDEIKLRFDADLNVQQQDLQVAGRRRPQYKVESFSYDALTHTATWKLAAPVEADRLTVSFGDQSWRLDVLPGDATRQGSVTVEDYNRLRSQMFSTPVDPTRYSVFHDLNGDGLIDASDVASVWRALAGYAPATALFSNARIA